MTEKPATRPNWWAGVIGAGMILPIAWISFGNPTSAIIMAVAVGAAGLFLFPRKVR